MPNSFSITDLPCPSSQLEIRATYPNASPEFLFDAFTQPELLARWWVPQAEIDSYPYGSYRFRWPRQGSSLFGTLLAYLRGKHLKFTWKWDHAPELPQRTVDIRFSAAEQGAVLHLTHGSYDSGPRDMQDRENHRTGWHHFLSELARVAESESGARSISSEAL
jgi:uncharacterized protein YndB with AHSA1/START domain